MRQRPRRKASAGSFSPASRDSSYFFQENRISLIYGFPVDMHTAFIRARGIKAFCTGVSVVKLRSVFQRIYRRIDRVPQFMTQGRAQIVNNKRIAFFYVSASASAFCYRKSDFTHYVIHLQYSIVFRRRSRSKHFLYNTGASSLLFFISSDSSAFLLTSSGAWNEGTA